MYRTLSNLRDSVNRLIEQQGENAPVAAFVFTKEDVFFYPKDENGIENLDEQIHLNSDDTDDVLLELGSCDYIYEQVFEIIDDEVRRVRNKVSAWIMTLTPEQISEIVEQYCDRVVDEMDKKSMEQMVYELLVDSFAHESENDMESLITSIYGEEYYQELVESVTVQ